MPVMVLLVLVVVFVVLTAVKKKNEEIFKNAPSFVEATVLA
jgi:nitric oxide reductase large subunit